MVMSQQYSVYPPQPILREPLQRSPPEVLSHIDHDRPTSPTTPQKRISVHSPSPALGIRISSSKRVTHRFTPPRSTIRNAADVFLLIFFFPSGVPSSVDKHVRHGFSSLFLFSGTESEGVRQERWGTLPEAPVPRKMSSMSGSIYAECLTTASTTTESLEGKAAVSVVVVEVGQREQMGRTSLGGRMI